MRYIECPDPLNVDPEELTVFLGGGITSCPEWQTTIMGYLTANGAPITAVNPRRRDWNPEIPGVEEQQIKWEFNAFRICKASLFWFPHETLCPITLLELGKMMMRPEIPLFVGCHPQYHRWFDVMFQLQLERPEVKFVRSLHNLARNVTDWANNKRIETASKIVG